MAACANSHHFLQGKTSQLNSSMGNFAGRGRGVHACMCMCVCVCVCVEGGETEVIEAINSSMRNVAGRGR